MKQICYDILKTLQEKPGLSLSKVGIELSGSWGSSYTRMTCAELIHQGLILTDTSGKRGHSMTLSESGLQAIQALPLEA